MKLAELNEQIIGKRVTCIHGGENRQGTILALVVSSDPYTHQVCSRGVRIKLDKPVFFATGYGVQHTEWWEDEYDSTARVFDGKGNLELTNLIAEA